mmetsp:Transcript_15435/g.22742  ORF Transcript_15435/g.22742 Transcript_15435/m.22742 type:complete len:243 (-) Transcript_15435:1746-2474(-)
MAALVSAKTLVTASPLKKRCDFKTAVVVVELAPLLHSCMKSTSGPARVVDACSMKSLQALRNASSKSRLLSTDCSWTDTPSRRRVTNAFSVLIEKMRRFWFARKRVTAFPASEKSSWRSTARSWMSNGESCSRRINKCFTKNRSECNNPCFCKMVMDPSFKHLVHDCTACNAISSNTRGSTTRNILLSTLSTLLMGGNHASYTRSCAWTASSSPSVFAPTSVVLVVMAVLLSAVLFPINLLG